MNLIKKKNLSLIEKNTGLQIIKVNLFYNKENKKYMSLVLFNSTDKDINDFNLSLLFLDKDNNVISDQVIDIGSILSHKVIKIVKCVCIDSDRIAFVYQNNDGSEFLFYKIQQSEANHKSDPKRLKTIIAILVTYIFIGIIGFTAPRFYYNKIQPMMQYKNAIKLIDKGMYDEAISSLTELKSYKDSDNKIKEARYKKACDLIDQGNFQDAIDILSEIIDYDGADTKINECREHIAAKELSELKETTIADLNGIVDISQYREAEQEQISSAIETAKTKIEESSEIEEIDAIMADLNTLISYLKTDDEYNKEEQDQVNKKETDTEANETANNNSTVNHPDISELIGTWRCDSPSGNYRIFTISGDNNANNTLYDPNGKVLDVSSGNISWNESGYMIVTGINHGYEGGVSWYKIENVTANSFDDTSLQHHYYRIQ